MKQIYSLFCILCMNFFSYIGTKAFIQLKTRYRASKYIPSTTRLFGEPDKEFIKDKRLISISPGGYKGVYMLGVSMYIRNHYDLDNFIYSGASAGAWISLLLCYKKDAHYLKNIVDDCLNKAYSLYDLEMLMKKQILMKCVKDDFDLRRLFIGVTTIDYYKANTTIFSGFINLEDAIDCCIASSHIPLITGGFINKYNNRLTFDGGFSKYPYLDIIKPVLHITPSMWMPISPTSMNISDYTTLFSKNKMNFIELYENGYNDTEKNKDKLDQLLNSNHLS